MEFSYISYYVRYVAIAHGSNLNVVERDIVLGTIPGGR
jgi:hypothetical protein